VLAHDDDAGGDVRFGLHQLIFCFDLGSSFLALDGTSVDSAAIVSGKPDRLDMLSCKFGMTKILMVASEARPFAKTGGLADVLGSLPEALHGTGDNVAVLLPRYRGVALEGRRIYDHLPIWLGGVSYATSIYQIGETIPYYFLDCPELYDREGLYGNARGDFPDNHIRFGVLSRAALEVARRIFRPQVFHCHDWQSGLVPAYLRILAASDPTFIGLKTLFTIHNLGYQGLFPRSALADIGLPDTLFRPDALEFFGRVNFMKAGILYSDAVSTVSKAYAREIQTPEYGWGLDGLLRSRAAVLSGIVNGVDYSQWNPETDPYLAAHYSKSDLSGKRICKRALLHEFGFDTQAAQDRPLIGIVTRLAGQKGADLIAEIGEDLAKDNLSLIALGSGDAIYERILLDLAKAHPENIAVRIGYDDRLAHRIEAGADMFLMPSRYEPCGLNQIYSLKYGTIPVVRATGGLDDTIEEHTGFKFREYSSTALLEAIRTALVEFRRPEQWSVRMERAMSKDFSWDVSAREYSDLYRRLAGRS
jgi:starch synthase